MIHSRIENLNECSKGFIRLADRAINHHFNRFRIFVDENITADLMNYRLSESDFDALKVSFGWVEQFTRAIDAQLEMLQNKFTTENFGRFSVHLLEYLITKVESNIFTLCLTFLNKKNIFKFFDVFSMFFRFFSIF